MASESHVALGQVLIAIAEPHRDPGTLHAYHRWFERDHMYSAVLIGPGAFAANRFVATRELKTRRYPTDGGVFEPVDAGTFAALYFIAEGLLEEHFEWSFAQSAQLGREGRNDPNRDLTLTWLCDYLGAVARDAESAPPEIALDAGYPGLVMVWVDCAPGVSTTALVDWLRDEHLPRSLPGSASDQALLFGPRDFPPPDPAIPLTPGSVVRNQRVGKCVLLLHFLEEEPEHCWERDFADLGERVAKGGLGQVALAAPYHTTRRGRRLHPEQLW